MPSKGSLSPVAVKADVSVKKEKKSKTKEEAATKVKTEKVRIVFVVSKAKT